MQEDEEGFLYPSINTTLCINCGLCEKVCPVLNQEKSREPYTVFAAKNPNEKVRIQSSSGGIFTMLAEQIIDDGGIVFGVGFNKNWEAYHSFTDNKKGLATFRTSKYIQSRVGNTYKEAEIFLKQGRKVLYSGTPCQILGLKKFLRKEYDNLFTIDFICHGVPSPGVFRWYIGEEIAQLSKKKYNYTFHPISKIPNINSIAKEYGYKIENIQFRDKRKGWKKFSLSIELSKIEYAKKDNSITISSTLDKNSYLRGFIKNLYLRPSCHSCPTKELKSGSDITIGDYWGIKNLKPEIDDDKGISAIIINTEKGYSAVNRINAETYEMEYASLCRMNPAIIKSALYNPHKEVFFLRSKDSFKELIQKYCKTSYKRRLADLRSKTIRHLLGDKLINKIKRIIGRNIV